jgi:hypothetical protein
MWTRVLILFLVIMGLKVIRNSVRYFQTDSLYDDYVRWLAGERINLQEKRALLKKLMSGAGVQDSFVGFAEPVGYFQIRSGNASVWENFPSNREDCAVISSGMFNEARGTYKRRVIETFSPLYWIELVINMPRELLTYLGLSPQNAFTKIAQLAWWAIVAIGGFLYALYKPQVEEFVRNWIQHFLNSHP